MEEANMYAVTMKLNVPKSNLLTFAIFSRDFDKDVYNAKNDVSQNSAATEEVTAVFMFCISFCIGWMKFNNFH